MFSIIIPCFNKQHQILTTLESILNQSFQDYEIIIVDDGSTDHSVNLINSISDNRIKLIQQQNAGVSVARNQGIKNAHKRWIAFLDADDWWHPNYLENMADLIKKFPNESAFSASYFSLPDKNNWLPYAWQIKHNNSAVDIITNLPAHWIKSPSFFTSSVIIKKNFLELLPTIFIPNETNGEDLDLWFRIAEKTPFYHLTTKLVVYRTVQSNSLSKLHNWKDDPPFLKRMEQRAIANNMPIEIKESTLLFVSYNRLNRSRKAVLNKQRLASLRLIWKAKYAISTKNWWFSLIMALFLSKKSIAKWQKLKHPTKDLT